jgi:hypothetical protein
MVLVGATTFSIMALGTPLTTTLKKTTMNVLMLSVIYAECHIFQRGEISCQFLPSGGSMGLGYVLQLLLSEKITKLPIIQ